MSRNIYTLQQLIKVLSSNNGDYVNVIPVNRECFFNWDSFLTKTLQYKKAIKDVSKFHCFYHDMSYDGVFRKQYTKLNNEVVQETIHKKYSDLNWNDNI